MAAGAALFFNIVLPINFSSPYKATNIRDFWRRWHITLSRFFRDYVYIPLGGNRFGLKHTFYTIMVTFFLTGLWHGAGWTFIIWGIAHGLCLCVFIIWRKLPFRMWRLTAWFLTFVFVNVSWVIFRADTPSTAWAMLRSMAGQNGVGILQSIQQPWDSLPMLLYGILWSDHPGNANLAVIVLLLISSTIAFTMPNSSQLVEQYYNKQPAKILTIAFPIIFIAISLVMMVSGRSTPFLYFDF